MPEPPFDPFSTMKMRVPHLAELLARLRGQTASRSITVIHATKPDEGEWIFANAASRLTRTGVRVFGPEPMKAKALVEQAALVGAKIAYIGELRREEDARAMRAAASFGIAAVATVTCATKDEAQHLVEILGPWSSYDLAVLA